jgi:hypothetical protein
MTTITTAEIIITAPTTIAAAMTTITAEMICSDVLLRRACPDGPMPTLPPLSEFIDDSYDRRSRCYWW